MPRLWSEYSWQFFLDAIVNVAENVTNTGVISESLIMSCFFFSSFVSFSQLPYLSSIRFGSLQTAVSQAAVGGGGTAADNLELFLSTVGPVQQLFDKLLKTQFSIGFTRSCFLQELVDLGHLSEWGGNERKGDRKSLVIACQFDQCIKEYWLRSEY